MTGIGLNSCSRFRRLLIVLTVFAQAMLLFGAYSSIVLATGPNQSIFSRDSSPFSIPYQQWLEAWWQWNIAFPQRLPDLEHPRENYTADKCSWKQDGPVWFLHEQFGPAENRTCEIPQNKGIFAPIYTTLCYNNYRDVLTDTDEEIEKCLTSCSTGIVISATLDGRTIQNPQQYHDQTRFYWITIPNDNIFDAPPGGLFRGKGDAYFLMLEPLPPGKHDLRLTSSIFQGPDSECNSSSDVTYQITVK